MLTTGPPTAPQHWRGGKQFEVGGLRPSRLEAEGPKTERPIPFPKLWNSPTFSYSTLLKMAAQNSLFSLCACVRDNALDVLSTISTIEIHFPFLHFFYIFLCIESSKVNHEINTKKTWPTEKRKWKGRRIKVPKTSTKYLHTDLFHINLYAWSWTK